MAKRNQEYRRNTQLAAGFYDYEIMENIKKFENKKKQYEKYLGKGLKWGWISSSSYAEMWCYSLETVKILDAILFEGKVPKYSSQTLEEDSENVDEVNNESKDESISESNAETSQISDNEADLEQSLDDENKKMKASKKKNKKKNIIDNLIESNDTFEIEEVKQEETLNDVLKMLEEKELATINLSEIYDVEKKKKEYILGDDIFDLSLNMFLLIIDEVAETDTIPVFILFESDLINLDSMKDTNDLARHIIKFFAQDDNNMFSRLVYGAKPAGDNLIKYCNDNNITLVSGDAVLILKSKLNKGKVLIPKCMKEVFQNPCQGSSVFGFDTCATFVNNDILKDVLKEAKSVLLSDIQFEQIGDVKSYILKVCAYYGKILPAKKNINGVKNSDRDIVQFYKNNPVDNVFTCDFGFKMFAKFAGVNCSILSTEYSTYTASEIFQRITSASSRGFKEKEIDQCQIVYDFLMNRYDGKLRIFTDALENITIYNSNYHKRTFGKKFTEVKKGEFVVIREGGKILITIVTNIQFATGKVLYFGVEETMPNCYNVFK